jgi:hypothetical protein
MVDIASSSIKISDMGGFLTAVGARAFLQKHHLWYGPTVRLHITATGRIVAVARVSALLFSFGKGLLSAGVWRHL